MSILFILSGLVTGPILGFLLVDLSRRVMMKRYNDPFYASFFATNIAMFVVTAASCGLSFLAAIKEPIEIHWLTIFCDFIVRAMLYVVRNVMLIILNRDDFFGRVMGVANAVAIVTGFLMPSFLELVKGPFGGDYAIFELIFGGINVAMLAIPVFFFFQVRSYKERVLENRVTELSETSVRQVRAGTVNFAFDTKDGESVEKKSG